MIPDPVHSRTEASMNTSSPSASHHPVSDKLSAEHLSALCDGSINESDLDTLMGECRNDAEALQRWDAYQIIGAAIRGNDPVLALQSPARFLEGVRSGIQAEVIVDERVSLASAQTLQMPTTDRAAANDGVFRWKLVAGFASFAAVAAVGWNLMAFVPSGQAQGSQLAQSIAPPVLAVETASSPGTASPALRSVAVETQQGRLIRDAELERLLAEHRQHGGMSAFQNPTGFIRNATYDADAR